MVVLDMEVSKRIGTGAGTQVITKEFTDGLCQENPAGLQARHEVNDGVRGGAVEKRYTCSEKSTIPTRKE